MDRTFAEGCIDEFRLYWQERGESRTGWEATFVNNVKRQWEHRPTPKSTPSNGQRYPSNDPHEKHGRLVTGNNSAIEQWLNRDNPASPFTVTVIPTPVLEITHANH